MEEYREAVEAGAVPPEEVEWMIGRGLAKQSLRPSLRLAPSRRSTVANASLEIAEAPPPDHAARAADRLRWKQSLSWRLGSGIVRALRAPVRLLRRTRRSLTARSR